MADLYPRVFWHEFDDEMKGPLPVFVKSQEQEDQDLQEAHSTEDAHGNPVLFIPDRTCCEGVEGCERCQQYKCPKCETWRPWWHGQADDQFPVCDACFVPDEAT